MMYDVPDPLAVNSLLSPYFEWIRHIHRFLLSWNNRLIAGVCTYKEILHYKENHVYVTSLGDAVAASAVVLSSDELVQMLSQYCGEFEELCMVLIPHVTIRPKFHYK